MKKIFFCLMVLCVGFFTISSWGYAEEATTERAATEEKKQSKRKRAKMLHGNPVHTNIGGGGSLPKGAFATIYNVSVSDKTRGKRGYKGSDVYSQNHMLKIRYGLTNHWEIKTVTPYVNNGSRNPTPSNKPNNIEGLGDQALGIVYSPFQMHQGDPFALSFGATLKFPTGAYGDNHPAGNGAWAGQLNAAIGSFVTENIRLSTEIAWNMSFERGNQKVRRGDTYQWSTMARYLFTWFDIGIESSYVHNENGDKRTPGGIVNLKNGGTEWHVGPSMNFAIDELRTWFGFGAYFPVMQDKNGPAAVDNIQYHFKLARLW